MKVGVWGMTTAVGSGTPQGNWDFCVFASDADAIMVVGRAKCVMGAERGGGIHPGCRLLLWGVLVQVGGHVESFDQTEATQKDMAHDALWRHWEDDRGGWERVSVRGAWAAQHRHAEGGTGKHRGRAWAWCRL